MKKEEGGGRREKEEKEEEKEEEEEEEHVKSTIEAWIFSVDDSGQTSAPQERVTTTTRIPR